MHIHSLNLIKLYAYIHLCPCCTEDPQFLYHISPICVCVCVTVSYCVQKDTCRTFIGCSPSVSVCYGKLQMFIGKARGSAVSVRAWFYKILFSSTYSSLLVGPDPKMFSNLFAYQFNAVWHFFWKFINMARAPQYVIAWYYFLYELSPCSCLFNT